MAHNFGDVRADNRRSDFVPSLAARVKALLEIKSPKAVCYDIPFGCPGWLQGLIQAHCFLAAGSGERALVILQEQEGSDDPGEIEVSNPHGSVVINQAGWGTEIPVKTAARAPAGASSPRGQRPVMRPSAS